MRPNIRTRFAGLFVAMMLMLSMAGCKDDAYTAASKSADTITSSVKAAIDWTKQAYDPKCQPSQSCIDRDEKNAIVLVLIDITSGNDEFIKDIKSLHAQNVTAKANYIDIANTFVDSTRTLLASGTLHVKNPQKQADLDLKLKAISAGLNGIGAAIELAKGQ
jgi:hypothetical protein